MSIVVGAVPVTGCTPSPCNHNDPYYVTKPFTSLDAGASNRLLVIALHIACN